jgi:hypothetical protein
MFHGLKLYTVHTKSGSDHTLARPVFVREGFNWYAFVFTFMWAFYQRLWLFGAAILMANFAAALLLEYKILTPSSALILQLGLQVIVGFFANDLLRARMQKRGYIFEDITSGDSLLRAEQRYFDRLVA